MDSCWVLTIERKITRYLQQKIKIEKHERNKTDKRLDEDIDTDRKKESPNKRKVKKD